MRKEKTREFRKTFLRLPFFPLIDLRGDLDNGPRALTLPYAREVEPELLLDIAYGVLPSDFVPVEDKPPLQPSAHDDPHDLQRSCSR